MQTQDEILQRCIKDLGFFAKTFFPERFSRPFSPLHHEIFELLNDTSLQRVAIAAPRGFGKTSIINFALPAQALIFNLYDYIVTVSCSAKAAIEQTENLKSALLAEEMVTKLIGSIRPESTREWSKESWITRSNIKVLPRGAGQQIRGLNFDGKRPGLIVIDDLEDSEGVMNEDRRSKLWDWFLEDLSNSIDRSSKEWRIIVLGTILHEDSLLQKLLDHKHWRSKRLSICDASYRSNWPEFMSDKEVLALANEFRDAGKLDSFCREYMNLPVPPDGMFTAKHFVNYDEEVISARPNSELTTLVIVDPAKNTKVTSDYTAIVGVSMDRANGLIYVRDLIMARLHVDEIIKASFKMADTLGTNAIAIEVTTLHEFIMHPFRQAAARAGAFFELIPLRSAVKKEERIGGLLPFYRQGKMRHNPACCAPLEAQLLSYPRSRFDDAMDALAYMIMAFDAYDKLFEPDLGTGEAYTDKELAALEALEREDSKYEAVASAFV